MRRLPIQSTMMEWLSGSGRPVAGRALFEVGTGHVPLAPIGFFLCGARSIMTVDLHRRIHWGLTRRSLEWIADHRREVFAVYGHVTEKVLLGERFALLCSHRHDPAVFFAAAGIEYKAPFDAARTALPAGGMDGHFSINTLEHIPPLAVRSILLEAKRILAPGGWIMHFADLSDHFQHGDPSITKIHFLRFGEEEWQRIAGNEFAYCNRLRASEYRRMFRELGLAVEREEGIVDQACLAEAAAGRFFKANPRFSGLAPDDLCTVSLRILARHDELAAVEGAKCSDHG